MGMKRTIMAGGLAAALLVGGTSCSKAAEKLAEKATGCENIDASGDEVGAECDGVSAGVDADGNVAVTDEDGNSIDVSGQGDGTLPEGWPSGLTLPGDASILASNVTQQPKGFTVIAGTDGDVAAVAGDIKNQLTAAGYSIDSESTSDAGGSTFSTLTASGPDFDASVAVSESQDSGDAALGNVSINWTLTEATP